MDRFKFKGTFYYVVTRDGRRVSKKNHETRDEAIEESKYWTKLVHWHDPKSIIRIRKTDKPNRIK